MSELSDAEVFGSAPAKEMSDAEVFGQQPPSPPPQAFTDRVEAGQKLDESVKQKQGRGLFDILLGINGPRYQLWPEQLVRSALSLPHDVATGEVNFGLRVRPQDTDESTDVLAQDARVMDLAGFGVGGWSPARVSPIAPVAEKPNSFARIVPGADGSLQHQVVGTLPRDGDFKVGAQVLGSDAAESNLRTLWEERGIHPAEAVHDSELDAFLKEDLQTPPEHPRDESGLPAVKNSPVPEGTPRTELARTGEAHIDSILESPVTRRNIDNPVIDDTHDVPYAAGGSVPLEDPTMFIDRHFPRSMTIDGVTFDPADPFTVHENIEQHVMEFLTKGGMDDQTAYKVAHFEFAEKAEGAWYAAHGIDQAKAEAAYQPFIDSIQHENPENPPPNLYKKPYPHDDVNAAQGEPLAEPKPTKAMIAQAKAILDSAEASQPLRAVGAEVTGEQPSLAQQPPPPAGRLVAAAQAAGNRLFDIGRDIQMLVAPMATGTRDSMALAKDFANAMRRNRWEWQRVDTDIAKRFNAEQRERMWNAADEESVARQLGESREHQGLVTLEPAERAAVEALQQRAQTAWLRAVDLGMVEGDGLPAYTPRMVMNVVGASAKDGALPLNGIGANLKTTTSALKHRKYMTAEETEAAAKRALGEGAELARDIRTLPLRTAQLEDAIAGRTLIDNIKAIGKQTGSETVAEGGKPAGSEFNWFTIDHPAFRTWRPKLEEADTETYRAAYEQQTGQKLEKAFVPLMDRNGEMIFEQVPLYVRSDFEGPLRAVLTQKSGPTYGALMSIKAKTMSLIMNSPLIHNAVEFGRAFPAMPVRIFKAYFDGNRAKNDPAIMGEAIDNGLVPIGKRFFNQDIDSIMEEPNLTPGRSWTAQALGETIGRLPQKGMSAEDVMAQVKRDVDKAGDFWHNTLLWDRVADLQMGLYVNLRGDIMRKGVDQQTASRVAAHLANRYAGSLPREAMSSGATKVANFMMFSRTFTMGNLGVMKDALTGLPKDVMAQIERDMGTVDPAAAGYAKSLARRKAFATVVMDVGLLYVGNSILQSALNVMLGDSSPGDALNEEMHGYVKRAKEQFNKIEAHPLEMSQYLDLAGNISSTSQNEPGKQDRLKIGYAKDGTAIYARSPFGKIGEEFVGYLTSPLDMLRRKEGTLARPLFQVIANDKGFGRKIYDPDAHTPLEKANTIWQIVKHFGESQIPEGQLSAFADLIKGEGDPKVNELQAFGPIGGVTFSKGAPGGPAVGELYKARQMHDFKVNMELPDIRRQILRGDVDGARERMHELGVPRGLARFYERTTLNPALRLSGPTLRRFYQYATPEQRQRLEEDRGLQ